ALGKGPPGARSRHRAPASRPHLPPAHGGRRRVRRHDVRDASGINELQQQSLVRSHVPAGLARPRVDAPVPAQPGRPRDRLRRGRSRVRRPGARIPHRRHQSRAQSPLRAAPRRRRRDRRPDRPGTRREPRADARRADRAPRAGASRALRRPLAVPVRAVPCLGVAAHGHRRSRLPAAGRRRDAPARRARRARASPARRPRRGGLRGLPPLPGRRFAAPRRLEGLRAQRRALLEAVRGRRYEQPVARLRRDPGDRRGAAALGACALDRRCGPDRSRLRAQAAGHRVPAGARRCAPASLPRSARAVRGAGAAPVMRRRRGTDGSLLASLPWTLAALGVAVAPHVRYLPAWITAVFVACAAVRWQTERKRWRLPPAWARILLALACFLGVLASFETISGVGPGSALLAVMAALKLLETRQRRDQFVLLFISIFLVMATLLREQYVWSLPYLVAALAVVVTAWLRMSTADPEPVRDSFRTAGRLLLHAAPLAVAMWIFFPRIATPLWSVPIDTGTATTGLSDTMRPGDISRLSRSDAVAFRVQFEGAVPEASRDRKSTRLNSSHVKISYAVFC